MVGGTRKMSVPIMPQRYYTRFGEPAIPYAGVNWDAERHVFEGVDCYAPEWRMQAKHQILASAVTPDFRRWIMAMSKTVNAVEFRGLPPGTVLYLGVDMDETFNNGNKLYDITHQFVIEPNMIDFFYDGIFVPLKEGHEYMWTSAIKTESGPRTTQVNIAPMYAKSDLNTLHLT
jgi:hypothetical protein